MNAIETILSRKSIPLMEDPKPNKNQLKKIYKAGLRAPDHGGLNPWKFIEIYWNFTENQRNLLIFY